MKKRKKPTLRSLRAELTQVTRERDYLNGLCRAAESVSPDSWLSRHQVAHRNRVRKAVNAVFGSRKEVVELLNIATDALEWYAGQPGGERAKVVFEFVGGQLKTEPADEEPL